MDRIVALAVLAALSLTGCYRWTQADPLRPQLHGDTREVRIVWQDSTRVSLRDARVEGDSLIGWTQEDHGRDQRGYRRVVYALPLAEAARVEIRDIDTAKTLGTVLPLVGGVVAAAIMCAADESDWVC